ncbi:MAG TPA: type II secretion system protein [Mesotoga infera]|nr:type II secretion system protein [Mesotoga infera]
MSRKKGFSLVELLIVLAVMAALIATITPVALNAIKKSKATQVAQNLKTLASAIENAAYVNGADENGIKKPDSGYFTDTNDIKLLARDINVDHYGIAYKIYTGTDAGKVDVYIRTDESVDPGIVAETLMSATKVTSAITDADDYDDYKVIGNDFTTATTGIQYTFTFNVY